MPTKTRTRIFTLMIAFVFLLSAIYVVPAYADGETPPVDSPTAAEPADPPAQDAGTLQTPPEPVSSPDAAAPALSEFPQGTQIVVVNTDGEAIPLATQEAAQAIVTGDPIWCPAGVAMPVSGGSGCTISYGSLYQLVNAINTAAIPQPAADGVIWIEGGPDSSANPILLNGASLTTWANFKVTFKGGWDGLLTNTVNTANPSTFTKYISITNWSNDVTFSDVWISVATLNPLLKITTTKNITLTNVLANSNSSGVGAQLQNDIPSGIGNVSVTNSSFNNNSVTGLYVTSNGTITLKDVTAGANGRYGAYLDNHTLLVAKAVTLTGTNTFNYNGTVGGYPGLYVDSFGQITLNNITASNNGSGGFGPGAYLSNNYALSTGGVSLTGTNIFNDNQAMGLYIESRGAIKLNSVYANSNLSLGVQIANFNAVTAQPVTLTGTNEIKYNGSIGLSVISKGQISLSNMTANSNGNVGAALTNTGSFAAGVTVSGTNFFKNNKYTGLSITSNGTVLVNSVTAEANGIAGGSGYGLLISNESVVNFKGVTLTGSNFFTGNKNDGLMINSSGIIVLNNISATGTLTGNGALINNSWSGVGAPKTVTLAGINIFNDNNFTGLDISSTGAITLNNVSANNNGSYGANINNAGSTLPQAVSLKGTNSFSGNQIHGLYVQSLGAILTNSITAVNNVNGNGAYLDNSGGTSVSKVTMTGTNLLTGNNLTNLFIQSIGVVTINSVTANGSTTGNGAQIQNTASSSAGVTLTGSNFFNSNSSNGLIVTSNGAITVNALTASNNGSGGATAGAFLNNSTSGAKAGVVVSGVNTFNGNSGGADGLRIWSLGNIKVNSVNASSNSQKGVSIGDSSFIGSAIGSVTLTGTNVFDLNFDDNLSIQSAGLVSLGGIKSTGSIGGAGANIDNTALGTSFPKTVALTGVNVFSGNGDSGLIVNSYGLITINNVTAENNGQYGSFLSNIGATTPAGVTLIGANSFNSNGQSGTYIETKGQFNSAGITANSNGNIGASLNALAGAKLSGANTFSTNVNGGLNVSSNGLITINNLTAIVSTSGYGATLNNLGTPPNTATPKGVTLTGINNTSNNRTDGLVIDSYGSVLINSLTANNNGVANGKGADIDNNAPGATLAANVTLTGTNSFNGNKDQGLYIDSFGSILINNLTAKDSISSRGADLLNDGAPSNLFGVTLTGANTFVNNSTYGLFIQSKGTVSLASVTATFNSDGVYINNTYAGPGAPKPVNITGTNNFSSNSASGLYISSNGIVSANNTTASLNGGGAGAYVDNSGATTPAAVNFTGTNIFNNNVGGSGVQVISRGLVTLSNITANGNAFAGMAVDNSIGTAGVNLTGSNSFNENGNLGATIVSLGAVNLTKVTADLNTGSGLFVNTTSTFNLTCGDFNKNTQYGWSVSNATVATLTGVFSSSSNMAGPSNTSGVGSVVTVRNCPLP